MKRNHIRTILTSILIIIAHGCSPLPIHEHEIKPIPKLTPAKDNNIAVVLGAGGARGFAHIGVLEELHNAGIYPDIVVGCSAGAIIGSIYSDEPDITKLKNKLLHRSRSDFIQLSMYNPKISLVSNHKMKEFLASQLSTRDFTQLKKHFVSVSTNLINGKRTPINSGDLINAVVASSAVPGVIRPEKINGQYFVDGAVSDPLPVMVAKNLKAKFIIAVDISPTLPKTMPTNLFGVMARSLEISYQNSSQISHDLADVTIDVKLEPFGMFADNRNIDTYQQGRKYTREKIDEIKRLLRKKTIKNSLSAHFH